MTGIATNQGPCQTQQLTSILVFLSFGVPLAHIRSSQKHNMNALKSIQKNESVVINQELSQT